MRRRVVYQYDEVNDSWTAVLYRLYDFSMRVTVFRTGIHVTDSQRQCGLPKGCLAGLKAQRNDGWYGYSAIRDMYNMIPREASND